MFTIPMGFVFELPILCFFLGRMGILTAGFMKKYRRYAIVLILIANSCYNAIGRYVDPILPVAVPLWILYEISIGVVREEQEKQRKEKLDA